MTALERYESFVGAGLLRQKLYCMLPAMSWAVFPILSAFSLFGMLRRLGEIAGLQGCRVADAVIAYGSWAAESGRRYVREYIHIVTELRNLATQHGVGEYGHVYC